MKQHIMIFAFLFLFSNKSMSKDYWNGSTTVETTTNGSVGIGTLNPKKSLHVNGDYYGRGHIYLYSYNGEGTSGTAFIQARDESGTTNLNLQFRTQLDGILKNTLFLKNSGQVGIGTTNPQSLLHVYGDSPELLFEENDVATNQKNWRINTTLGNLYFQAMNDDYTYRKSFFWFEQNSATPDAIAFGANLKINTKYISNDGDDEGISINSDGQVCIGTSTTSPDADAKLTVAGKISARDITIKVDAGADFVFEKDYALPSLEYVEQFIQKNKHLPEIPSVQEMRQNGVQVSEMQSKLLQKIEELTIHMIKVNKKVDSLEKENHRLKEMISAK